MKSLKPNNYKTVSIKIFDEVSKFKASIGLFYGFLIATIIAAVFGRIAPKYEDTVNAPTTAVRIEEEKKLAKITHDISTKTDWGYLTPICLGAVGAISTLLSALKKAKNIKAIKKIIYSERSNFITSVEPTEPSLFVSDLDYMPDNSYEIKFIKEGVTAVYVDVVRIEGIAVIYASFDAEYLVRIKEKIMGYESDVNFKYAYFLDHSLKSTKNMHVTAGFAMFINLLEEITKVAEAHKTSEVVFGTKEEGVNLFTESERINALILKQTLKEINRTETSLSI